MRETNGGGIGQAARVLLIGAGGLGSPAGLALSRAPELVRTLGIVDDDVVELTNLHRQILYDEADVGRSKVVAATAALSRARAGVATASSPPLEVVSHEGRFLPENAAELVSRYDLVVEGSDNFATKFLAADACALAGVPVVHAAAVRFYGTVLAVGPFGGPCYRCLFEEPPDGEGPQDSCAEAGVMGPVVGVVGAIQAGLALGLLAGKAEAGTLVTFDGKTGTLRRRALEPREGCPSCGRGDGPARPRRSACIEATRHAPAGTGSAPVH